MTFRIHVSKMRKVASKAVSQEEGKWEANTELISWFRANPVEIVEIVYRAIKWAERLGGLNNSKLIAAVKRFEENSPYKPQGE